MSPDNLSQAIIQQDIAELEDKLKQQAIMQIARKCASLPTIDHRTADEILDYEQGVMGLWGDE